MVKNCGELYAEVRSKLKNAGNESAEFEARCIFEQSFGMNFFRIMADRNNSVPDETANHIISMVQRRCKGYPLQYILGEWEFYGYPFKVGEGVLIPRPDTETLVDQVISICRKNHLESPKIMDLCSGSGCIAVALKKELPDAEVWAAELSDNALPYIKENALLNGVDINIIKLDVLDEKSINLSVNFDIIVSNPPYLTSEDMKELQTEVTYEPETALFGGTDGLDFYRSITAVWKNKLKNKGFIAYEFGLDQHEDVSRILQENGFSNIQLSRDTAGIIRTAAAQKLTED